MIMKRIVCLIFLVSSCCFAGDLTTLDGKTYRNITVTRVEADGLVVTHAEGGCKIEFLNLPEDVRKKYSYDPAKAEAAKKAAAGGSWQEMDQRMIFLTVQLSSVEASLTALNRAMISLGIQQVTHQSNATIARQANEAMDRNAGGPVPWADFYGHTAEKFFYHPIDIHTHYHTWTILGLPPSGRVASGKGVPSPQGLPVHQRPPQFDYIYHANADAERRAQAEVARLGNNAAAILERRRQLEAEQSALWCKIAFHAVAGRELLSKPLYYYDLKSAEADSAEGRQRLEALRAAMAYLRNGNKLAAMVEQGVDADAARCYSQLQAGIGAARGEMEQRLMAQPALVGDITDSRTMLGKFVAVAKRMGEVSANITDAHRLALDGDRAGDQGRKQTFRSQLQQSLMLCAEALLAGDECVNELARDWKAQPDLQTVAPASVTVQAMLVVPTPTVVAPTAAIPVLANTGDDAIAISTPDAVRILPLEAGQPRLYDSTPLRIIEGINPELSKWQFVSIPQRIINSYEIRVNQDGILYAFGGKKNTSSWNFIGADQVSKWENAAGDIRGININLCFRRKVFAGEMIRLSAYELQLAAKSIRVNELGRDKKAQSNMPLLASTATIQAKDLPANDPAWSHAVNLMSLLLPARDTVKGIWKLEAGKLIVEPSRFARILIPYEPPEEYDFRIILRRVAGINGAVQIFSHYNRTAMWILGGQKNTAFGFQLVAGVAAFKNRTCAWMKNGLEIGRDYTSILKVRNNGVKAYLDGKLISEWTTDYGDASLDRVWDLPDKRLLALGSSDSFFEFYKIDLLEVTGKGRAVRGDSATPPVVGQATGLQVEQQIQRFAEKMKSLNPKFSGEVQHKTKDGEVVELVFSSTGVTDISPIRDFPYLEVLRLQGSSVADERTFADLSPLKGLSLWCFEAQGNRISSLSPLEGMPLRIFRCSDNPIKDLTPLKGMPLGEIHVAKTEVSDLSPLVGMPLAKLVCQQSHVTDLLLLRTFDLKLLRCDFVFERDAKILRSIKTLEQINGLRSTEFWKRVAAGDAPQAK